MKQFLLHLTLVCAAMNLHGEDCNRDLFTAFYPAPLVAKTLERFDVPSEIHDAIIDGLNVHEVDVVLRVEQNAEKMNPNPLQEGNQQEIIGLFDRTVFEIFTYVLNNHGITNEQKISQMMSDILQQKADRFRECMESMPQTFSST